MQGIRILRAFTLVEVIIVVIILGIMASLVAPKILGPSIEKARFFEATNHLSAYVPAVRAYFLDHGSYANDCSDLEIEVAFKGFEDLNCKNNGTVSVKRKGVAAYKVTVDASSDTPVYSCPACPAYLQKLLPE